MAEQTTNFLSPLGYQLGIVKLPGIGFYTQETNLPSIQLPEANQATPFVTTFEPGDKLEFQPFTMNFMINEDMSNYISIFNWLIQLGFPNNYEEFLDGSNRHLIHMSDGFLQILGSNNAVIKTIEFKDMFPTSLGAVTFRSTDSDVNYIQATVDFRYTSYKFV